MDQLTNRKFCGYITNEQRKELIQFMEEYPELKCGKFTEKFSMKKAQELWMKLKDKLNALPGANKDWKQWRKVCIYSMKGSYLVHWLLSTV